MAISDRPRKRVPSGMNVAQSGIRIRSCSSGCLSERRSKRREEDKARQSHELSDGPRTHGVYRSEQICCARLEQFRGAWCLHKHSGTEWDEQRTVNRESAAHFHALVRQCVHVDRSVSHSELNLDGGRSCLKIPHSIPQNGFTRAAADGCSQPSRSTQRFCWRSS